MELKARPKIGAGRIRFGMTRDQVEAILGPPSKREMNEWPGGTSSETLSFESASLDATFDEEYSWRLCTLSFYAGSLYGVRPVGRSEEEGLAALRAAAGVEITLDDDFTELGMRDWSIEAHEASVWVNDGIIDSFTLHCAFDDSGIHPVIHPRFARRGAGGSRAVRCQPP